jgi:dUTP pyrophosphatase
VIVALINTDPDEPIAITRGDRVAQLVILAVPAIVVCEVEELSESPGGPAARGTGGYGHSGR